jgi:hypothetical protein
MPLINSPSNAARSKNIATEFKAGKPLKQAVAIGYAVQRREKPKLKTKKPKVKLPNIFSGLTKGLSKGTP